MPPFKVEERPLAGDGPICRHIESKAWRQARKLIDTKRKKKGKDDEYLKALDFYVACNIPSASDKAAALETLHALAADKVACGSIDDAAALQLYDEGIKAISGVRHVARSEIQAVCKIKQDAVNANPKKRQLCIACFKACVRWRSFDFARNIANVLHQNSKGEPDHRKFFFWEICTRWLCTTPYATVGQKFEVANIVLYKTIVRRKLDLAVADTPAKTNTASSISVQQPEELKLVYRFCDSLILSPQIGPLSAPAKGNWHFWRCHIEELHRQGHYERLWACCLELLHKAVPPVGGEDPEIANGADWLVWTKTFDVLSGMQGANPSAFTAKQHELLAIIFVFLNHNAETQQSLSTAKSIDKAFVRNARLALLEMVFRFSPRLERKRADVSQMAEFSDGDPIPPLTERTFEVFNFICLHADAPSTFRDLRKFVYQLSPDEQKQFLMALRQAPFAIDFEESESTMDINQFVRVSTQSLTVDSFEYHIRTSDGASDAELVNITLSCLRKYEQQVAYDDKHKITLKGLPSTDLYPGDDWLLMAAMSLIKLGKPRMKGATNMQSARRLMQVALILEFGAKRSKHNSEFSILLIRIYTLLGAGALAMRAFQRLKLKSIQVESLGYALLDGLSTLHPHPSCASIAEADDLASPTESLLYHQKAQSKYLEQIDRQVLSAFDEGSYNSVLEIFEVGHRIRKSLAAAVTLVELRRIRRLLGHGSLVNDVPYCTDLLPDNPELDFCDNADRGCFPNRDFPKASLSSDGPDGSESTYSVENIARPKRPIDADHMHKLLLTEQLWIILSNPTAPVREIGARLSDLLCRSRTQQVSSNQQDWSGTDTIMEGLTTATTRWLIEKLAQAHLKEVMEDDTASITRWKQYEAVITAELHRIEHITQDETFIPTRIATLEPLYLLHDLLQLVHTASQFIMGSQCPFGARYKALVSHLLGGIAIVDDRMQTLIKRIAKSVQRKGLVDEIISMTTAEDADFIKLTAERDVVNANEKGVIGVCIQELCTAHDPGRGEHIERLSIGEEHGILSKFAAELSSAWTDSVRGLTALASVIKK